MQREKNEAGMMSARDAPHHHPHVPARASSARHHLYSNGGASTRIAVPEQSGLSELAAPPPAAHGASNDSDALEQRQGESRAAGPHDDGTATRVASAEQGGLSELAAPKPARTDVDDASHPHLESTWHGDDANSDPEKGQPDDDWHDDSNDVDEKLAQPSVWLTQLYTIGHLVFFSLWGLLARLGVQWITFYPGAPVTFANLWANAGGCFVMGFLSEDRNLFRDEWGSHRPRSLGAYAHRRRRRQNKNSKQHQDTGSGETQTTPEAAAAHLKAKKTIPLYIGLSVGFCGTMTSFSTFARDLFFATANDLPAPTFHPPHGQPALPTATVPRNGGYDLESLLAVGIVTVAVCLSAHALGAHAGLALDGRIPPLPFTLTRRVLDPLFATLGLLCWVGAALLVALPPDRPGGPASAGPDWADEFWRADPLFPLVLAPAGCLVRFVLSVRLNGLARAFPLGTFAANVLGVAVFAAACVLQRRPLTHGLVGGGQLGCQALQGVQDGFSGALTTVSTWVAELRALKRGHAYFYGAATVLGAYAVCVGIMGGVRWSVGYASLACVVEVT